MGIYKNFYTDFDELNTTTKETIMRTYNIIDILNEMYLIDKNKVLSSLYYEDNTNTLYVSGDKVFVKWSYGWLTTYIKSMNFKTRGYIRKVVQSKLVEKQFTLFEIVSEEPSFVVYRGKSMSGVECYIWIDERDGLVSKIVEINKAKEILKEELKKIEYNKLKEENYYKRKLIPDPRLGDENEIYKTPEQFQINPFILTMEEALSVILKVQGEGRELSGEEIIAVKDLREAIDDLIGE